MRLCKKANVEGVYWVIISVLLASAALMTFGWHVNSVVTNSLPQKQFLARDVSLLTNVIYSAPGNIHYTYEPFPIMQTQLSDFNYKYLDGKFMVVEKNLEIRYPFGEDRLVKSTFSNLQKPTKLELTKMGGSFRFGKDLPDSYYSYNIKKPVDLSSDILLVSSLEFNPATGERYLSGDSFLQYSSGVNSKNNFKLSNVSVRVAFNLLSAESNDIIIGLVSSDSFKIYFSGEQAKYYASLISNSIYQSEKKFVPLVPVESTKQIILITVDKEFLSSKGESLKYSISEVLSNE